MKKIVSMTLVLVMAMTLLAACGGNTTSNETTAPAVTGPASALELMETVWGLYGDDEKFAVIGGSMAAPVDGAPGSFDLADENISYSLLIPADQLGSVTEAASMIHMMNANTFTAAAFKLSDGVSAVDFAEVMEEAVANNQWMCGFPETLLIQNVAGEYAVMAFGAGDLLNVFSAKLAEAYPQAETLVNEPIV